MHSTAMVSAMNGADVAPLRARLQEQIWALEAVSRRFDGARLQLPPADGHGVWRGPAHEIYVTGLEALGRELAAAGQGIERSLLESRRALSALVNDA